MNKKVLGIAVALMAVAMLATPVFAAPTKGQKEEVSLTWALTGTSGPPPYPTGNVMHRSFTITWDFNLTIDDGDPMPGNATTYRKLLRVQPTDKDFRLFVDYYVLELDGYDGTFEGNALIQQDYPAGEARVCHALLQGTGDFEGQTINAQQDWSATAEWTGYILKWQT